MGALTVHAGDFKQGKDHRIGARFLLHADQWSLVGEKIEFDQIEEAEQASEEAVKRIGGTVGWGLAGAALLGPLGLLAGALVGGRGKDVTFVCRFKDGRKMLATCSNKDWMKIQAALFK